ncbi:MAG: hypothetical protein MMC33_001943 [Icmadophila ericetorum]|nr:hypothetical protein [Icmadophila ericetorum]
MILRSLGGIVALILAARAAQPEAPAPISAPLRELPWGQLNFLHTTDTHGWHAGHLQEASFSADWGDYVAFAQHMREKADNEGVDMLLIDTGDRVEGSGLYDASDPKGKYTRKVFRMQDIDIITVGNHELYQQNTSIIEYNEMVLGFEGKYLASNLDIFHPETGEQVPFAPRYKKFVTKNQGIRILAFGFLFDFTGNYKNTVVQKVEDTIKEKWFHDCIRDRDVDLFLVAGHVGPHMKEFQRIFKVIRDVQWDAPIIFFGGHTHIRDYMKYDSKAYGLESGRYMETIGFQSISGLNSGCRDGCDEISKAMTASPTFARRYIDNNLFSLYHHASRNATNFSTHQGRKTTAMIASARHVLNLDEQYGCIPIDLWTNRVPYPDDNSIFSWLGQRVLPAMIHDESRGDNSRIILANTGALRFDLFKGPFTRDTTWTISPFNSGFRYIKDVPFSIADRMLTVLNNEGQILEELAPELPQWMLVPPEQISIEHDIIAPNIPPLPQQNPIILAGHGGSQRPLIVADNPQDQPTIPLTPGYTTTDDAGKDGDDTVHSQISFYRVPNCIESRVDFRETTQAENPETVDLVYLEFIQPWILLASKFLGGEYTVGDTEAYMGGRDFTGLISEWVKENWGGEGAC